MWARRAPLWTPSESSPNTHSKSSTVGFTSVQQMVTGWCYRDSVVLNLLFISGASNIRNFSLPHSCRSSVASGWRKGEKHLTSSRGHGKPFGKWSSWLGKKPKCFHSDLRYFTVNLPRGLKDEVSFVSELLTAIESRWCTLALNCVLVCVCLMERGTEVEGVVHRRMKTAASGWRGERGGECMGLASSCLLQQLRPLTLLLTLTQFWFPTFTLNISPDAMRSQSKGCICSKRSFISVKDYQTLDRNGLNDIV